MSFISKLIDRIFDEVKNSIKERVDETEADIKRRVRKIVTTAITIGVLASLGVLLLGCAAIFLLVGSLKYLATFMPAWEAWGVMGIISAIVGGLLLWLLFNKLGKQLG